MGKTLIIVESPAKAKTIGKFLGKNYTVKSSMGHVRDLPKSKIGVDVENNFEPHYITIRGKGEILKNIKRVANRADNILLAADPDREGEAIAWHLKTYLKMDEEDCRIEFNEITKDAVKNAVKNPRAIDMNRVDAQQARRILDRLVGYNLSPLLWQKVKKGLSAGRVQSVAVRLICDREEEIKKFVPEEYWSLLANLMAQNGSLEAKLAQKAGKKIEINDEKSMNKVLADLDGAEYKVEKIRKRKKKRNPVAPFITSSLQQEAARKLGYTAKKTMFLAQQLYEGITAGAEGVVGLITYMRTDSTRLSAEAQKAARAFIKEKFGADFVPEKIKQYASKNKAQDAHEAIRPTGVERDPEKMEKYLSADQFKLYKLIWERFVASQMSPAIMDTTSIDIKAADYIFRATGSVIRFAGFMQIYIEGQDGKKAVEPGILPEIKENEVLKLEKLDPKQHFTQPPPRYTEAMLVKDLEEKGIGRPSTYAPIIDTITKRGYVEREEKRFKPTELGIIVVDVLKEYFAQIMNVEFTADMEKNLDQVEEGSLEWQKVLSDFYFPFEKLLKHAEKEMKEIEIQPEESGELCEKCGKPMVYKWGRFGKFLACSGFPDCRNTKTITKPIGVKCLACGGEIVEKKTRRNRIFYGCDNYPKCKYVSWNKPIAEKCEECGTQLSEKRSKKGESTIICPNEDCPTRAAEKAAKEARKKKQAAEKAKTTKAKAKTTKAKAKTTKAKAKTTKAKAKTKTTKAKAKK